MTTFTKSKSLLLLLNTKGCEQQKTLNSLGINLFNSHFSWMFFFFPSIKSYSNALVLRLLFNVSWILNGFPLSIFRAGFISTICYEETRSGSSHPYHQNSLLMECLSCVYFNPHSSHYTWFLSRPLFCKEILEKSVYDWYLLSYKEYYKKRRNNWGVCEMVSNTCLQFKSSPGKLSIVSWMVSSLRVLGFGLVLDSHRLHTNSH